MEKVVVGHLKQIVLGNGGYIELYTQHSGPVIYHFSKDYNGVAAVNMLGKDVTVWLTNDEVTSIELKNK